MSNIVENKLNVVLNPAEMAQIVNSITHIMDAIPDTNLTPEQRATMLSMNVDNKIFAEDCAMELGISGAGIIPPFINAGNLQNDITLFEQMDNV